MTLHERDCAPCDAARRIVDELAAKWDPNDQWSEVEAIGGDQGTLRDQAIAITADVLHGLPIPAATRRLGPHGSVASRHGRDRQ